MASNSPSFGQRTRPSLVLSDHRFTAEAEAASTARRSALAKAYGEAKADALEVARRNSDQRRKAFAAELNAERLKSAARFETAKSNAVCQFEEKEREVVESDKSGLRAMYREQVRQFEREQAAAANGFNDKVAYEWRRFREKFDDKAALAAVLDGGRNRFGGGPTLATLFRDEEREEYYKLKASIAKCAADWTTSAKSEQQRFLANAIAYAQRQLAERIEQRRVTLDQRLSAMKSANEAETVQRIAELERDFERAEAERLAADQERLEHRLLAIIDVPSRSAPPPIKPVAFRQGEIVGCSRSMPRTLAAWKVAAGLSCVLAVGIIIWARSCRTDFRQAVPRAKERSA
jgi:hypothetical protein